MRLTLRFALRGGVAAVCLTLALTGSVRMANAQQPVEIDVAPRNLSVVPGSIQPKVCRSNSPRAKAA